MSWESTDQFGNMFIWTCEGNCVNDLSAPINSMVDELHVRNPENFQVTVDFGYGEINGPDPENVSHVIQASFLMDLDPEVAFGEVEALLQAAAAEKDVHGMSVVRA
ncbi:hypothetical protein QPK87_10795 [Kamptonema cortianum]|nr:hypothetical protein [Geitlerinema splendidum]MDK3157061.1 hypothetical protein [Kamptonema cortianum]